MFPSGVAFSFLCILLGPLVAAGSRSGLGGEQELRPRQQQQQSLLIIVALRLASSVGPQTGRGQFAMGQVVSLFSRPAHLLLFTERKKGLGKALGPHCWRLVCDTLEGRAGEWNLSSSASSCNKWRRNTDFLRWPANNGEQQVVNNCPRPGRRPVPCRRRDKGRRFRRRRRPSGKTATGGQLGQDSPALLLAGRRIQKSNKSPKSSGQDEEESIILVAGRKQLAAEG